MSRGPLVWMSIGLALIAGLFLALWIFATIWVLALIGAALAALSYAWRRLPRRWRRRKLPQPWR
jgi:membrane protein implicated in regulation of membrane protease activity